MSFAISHICVVAAGALAAPRGAAKARAGTASLAPRRVSAERHSPHRRGQNATALRAVEDDETPAPAPAPEELSFPELSDDEEVRGSQITAIITGTQEGIPSIDLLSSSPSHVASPRQIAFPCPSLTDPSCPNSSDRCRERGPGRGVLGLGAGDGQPGDVAAAAGGAGDGRVPTWRAKVLGVVQREKKDKSNTIHTFKINTLPHRPIASFSARRVFPPAPFLPSGPPADCAVPRDAPRRRRTRPSPQRFDQAYFQK